MLADLHAVRMLGSASAARATDLAAIAMKLSTVPASGAAEMLGPVGARFLAALADVVTVESHAVAALGDSVAAAGTTAHASATAYEEAESRAGRRLGA
jgi:hypothetical protein